MAASAQVPPPSGVNGTTDHPNGGEVMDSSPMGTESPGTSQMSPPPSYNEIPGTVRPLNRDVPPPSYEDAVDPNGNGIRKRKFSSALEQSSNYVPTT